ncbi:MAG: NmrA family NAD(P)-binding protein [Agriterribacter sp.]
MKIIVTGSLGHISKPLTEELVSKAHSVTVVSSKQEKQKDIEAMGAKAAIGSIEDVAFLTTTFTGADAAYIMEPPVNFFDKSIGIPEFYSNIARCYVEAIRQSGLKQVVHLSSIGGHTDKGNGMLAFHYYVEQIIQSLPADVSITTLRPVGFYYNLLSFIPGIKHGAGIVTNYNASYKEPWVAPADIAAVVAEEITQPFKGRKVRYIASDELTGNDIATILGEAIGKPDLQWTAIPDEQQKHVLLSFGMSEQAAKGLVEMNAARQTGTLFEDYNRNKPILGKTKLSDFAKEFAEVYNKPNHIEA